MRFNENITSLYHEKYEEQLKILSEKIQMADAIVVGGGSGISSAAGYNHYHS